ncbi:hypothetical protein SKAU_G00291130 [Synaphobranchus kaupii]|uniref:Uncharacterized protein n=1 Tax=Synaphobranchus kaupii TaxID=118154 RepID=A0A9Q1IK69_SYNKA|nr:hypothetical protein SKAU_G00291130 [Synaphobranchus kaupii]
MFGMANRDHATTFTAASIVDPGVSRSIIHHLIWTATGGEAGLCRPLFLCRKRIKFKLHLNATAIFMPKAPRSNHGNVEH